MGRLDGKTVLITAAAQGIGRRSAQLCASEGAVVIATDVNAAALAELATESPSVTVRRLDVLRRDEIETLAAELADSVDVLFNCAGCVPDGDAADTTDDVWQQTFDLNVRSMFWLCRAFLPAFRRRRAGSIINMASVAGLKGVPRRLAYGASKAAVVGLTKCLAADTVADGIRCNCICPGTVDTPSWRGRVAASHDPQRARAQFEARQPMGRVGTADEIAWMVVYLASDESSFTTGASMVVDGGWSM
ncbi:3-hydroxybutyrate dehydrogenase type 2 [Amphibalanus amphitrite]|uniref:Dehydrogenase/reductase SDR family member 6 n=1 Tax=Amphibalanus amphitrite TaxID=1232801 RepID=A0A6A4VKT4_AMPAM|nr:3-hydroxybutyrate dehydrogenase type 2-like [Amphibalanus amphitrite]XP_043234845.1 3-hydroxybutyrate dehydrogenase type 2-like [Amphibalanus amphitrite]KAF0292134.1 3-hydroxybutyrate dehydrogenase type 2 [Amphibalanus amphitrite]